MISLAPIMLLNLVIVLLLGLAFWLWILTERNRLQKTLIGIILLWVVLFSGLFANLIRLYNGVETPVSGVMNFHGIWMGMIGMFSLIGYPAVALHHHHISLSKTLSWLSPVLITLGVYIIWHLATETDMNYRYLSYTELWENRFAVPVILRSLMLILSLTYMALVLIHIWRLIPIYQKYCDDNYADTAHNVDWLRLVIAAIGSICVTYLVVLIWKNPIGELLYAVTTCLFFALLAVNAFSHKLFAESERIAVDWSIRHGWQLIERQQGIEKEVLIPGIELRLKEWMDFQKPYTDSDFTAEKVYAVFPELRYPALTTLLARHGHTFKSYVRELRVAEARRLMDENPNMLCKQIALQVGFSSSQVLSRSFICVTGESLSDLRKK